MCWTYQLRRVAEVFGKVIVLTGMFIKDTKYRRHTDPNGRYDQNEIKRNKGLSCFKQNCPIFRYCKLIQVYLRSGTLIGLFLWSYSF